MSGCESNRLVMKAMPSALMIVAAACGVKLVDPCAGVSGTCLAIQVEPSATVTQIDSLQIEVAGKGLDLNKPVPISKTLTLPIAVAVNLGDLPSSTEEIAITITASHAGQGSAGTRRIQIDLHQHETIEIPLNVGAAVPAQIGAACTKDGDCASLHCVDRVCCESACTGLCQACNLPTSPGTCSTITTPGSDPRLVCPAARGADGVCKPGGCSGVDQSCLVAPMNTPCQASCWNNTPSNSTCDGKGTCGNTVTGSACGSELCTVNATSTAAQCKRGCQSDSDCAPGYGCNMTTMSCGLVNGKACSPSMATTECQSGFCAPEGICCDRACTGQCEACSSNGSCGYVNAPVFPRLPCQSDPSYPMCNGSCSGAGPDCSFPKVACDTSTAGCFHDANLKQQFAQTGRFCGEGSCQPAHQTYCGTYLCHQNFCPGMSCPSCWGTCTSDAFCNTMDGYHCDPTAKKCM